MHTIDIARYGKIDEESWPKYRESRSMIKGDLEEKNLTRLVV